MASLFLTYRPEQLSNGQLFIPLNYVWDDANLSRILMGETEITEEDCALGTHYYVDNDSDVILEFQYDSGVISDNAQSYNYAYKIEFGTGFTKIGFNAFYSSDFETIILPDYQIDWEYEENDYDNIGGTFNGCDKLTTIIFPNNIYDYCEYMFQSCDGLTSINLDLNYIPNGMFYLCKSLKSVSISNSVTSIGTSAFGFCTSLTSITIPDSVTSIGGAAFYSCSGLTSVTCLSSTEPFLLSTTFRNVATGGTLYYPSGGNYSDWLSTSAYYLGYYGWNGVEMEPELTHSLSVDTSSISSPYGGGTYDITFTTENIDSITFSNDAEWISIVNDVNTATITISPNTGDARTSTITFSGLYEDNVVATAAVNITQSRAVKYGSIESSSVDINSDGQNVDINIIQTNMSSWDKLEISQGGDYAAISSYSFNDSYVHIYISANYSTSTRVAELQILGTDMEGVSRTGVITINQSGVVENSYIGVSTNDITLNEVGESTDIEVTYGNIDSINTPEVPDGYSIEVVSTSEENGETKVVYRVMKTSANNGNTTINFSGTNSDGSTTTSENINIEGWTAPTEPATITFTEYSFEDGVLVFDASGGTKGFDMIINGYTKPMAVGYTITDPNNVLQCTGSVLDYDDGLDYAVWDFEFTAIENTSSAAYDGTINITYSDGLTNYSKSIPFHIRHENEGLIETFSNNFEYDKEGTLLSLYDTITIGYYNIETINTPTAPSWITIGEGTERTGTFIGYDKVMDYPISVEVNEGAERTGIVVFSGVGYDGATYTEEVSVFQEGDDSIIVVDEGYIELQSLSLLFESTGGTGIFQVKYYDAQTIYMPELAADWATITETGSEEAEGTAWNGVECIVTTKTYSVTAEPSESGREMKVICKMLDNDNVYFEKDKFVIQQLAPDSTEIQGRLVVLRYSQTYSYYGSPNGFPPMVGYDNLFVHNPTFSESWCRLGNTNIKTTSTEYDYIYEYSFDMDVNNNPFSRSCTITFMGEGEDGTYVKSSITITQEGQDEILNEGESDNYRGYFMDFDGAVHSVSFITNPKSDFYSDIRLAGDSPVVVSYSDSKRLWEPIRTSTCTIKVVTSSYLMNLYTGKAQGCQVILKNEDTGNIEWVGYMQPNLYNQGFVECFEEIEFEASDCLSTLQYFNYEPHYMNGRMTVTFHDIISDIMEQCGLVNHLYLTEKTYSDTFQSRPLLFRNLYISEENFYSKEDEPWKMSEVLEEICKYMGLVCFQYDDSVYFMDYDMFKSTKVLTGYRYDKSDRWNSSTYVNISSAPNIITKESYRGTGADISLDDVFNKVSVKATYYNFEDVLPDLFEDDFLVNRFGEGSIISISRYGGRLNQELLNKTYYRVYDHQDINSLYYLPVKSPSSSHETRVEPTSEDFEDRYFFRKYVGANIVDIAHLNYSEANGNVGESKEFDRCLMISQLNRPWCGAEGTFHWEEYNLPIMEMKNIPVIFIDNTADDTVDRTPVYSGIGSSIGMGSTSSTPHNRQVKVPVPNYLVIKAEAVFVSGLNSEYYDGVEKAMDYKKSKGYWEYGGETFDHMRNTPALCFYLEIPQKGWWNGSGWVGYKTHFEVPLEPFSGDDWWEDIWGTNKNEKNNVETYLFLGTTGYKIPLPKEMTTTQEMYFAIGMPKRFAHVSDIGGGDYTGDYGNGYCFIKDLSINITNRNAALYEDEDVIYENIIDEGNVIDGDEIEVKLTSDRYNGFSFSVVSTKTAEDVNTTDILFYNKNKKLLKPEEAIVERYVSQYSTPSIRENVTLDMSFKPWEMIVDSYWDKDFVVIGQEIDYQLCRQTLSLLEKKTEVIDYQYSSVSIPAEGRSDYKRRTN